MFWDNIDRNNVFFFEILTVKLKINNGRCFFFLYKFFYICGLFISGYP